MLRKYKVKCLCTLVHYVQHCIELPFLCTELVFTHLINYCHFDLLCHVCVCACTVRGVLYVYCAWVVYMCVGGVYCGVRGWCVCVWVVCVLVVCRWCMCGCMVYMCGWYLCVLVVYIVVCRWCMVYMYGCVVYMCGWCVGSVYCGV